MMDIPFAPFDIVRQLASRSTETTSFVLYDPETGKIVQTGCCAPFDLEHQNAPGCALMLSQADLFTDYVDLGGSEPVIRPRPTIASLESLPLPAEVTVRCATTAAEDTYTVTDGSFEYADMPGRYTVTVRAWPWRDATFELEL